MMLARLLIRSRSKAAIIVNWYSAYKSINMALITFECFITEVIHASELPTEEGACYAVTIWHN